MRLNVALLELKKVSMTYYTKNEETHALSDISFEVNKGEFVAVLGPSGCGKTTLLSLICGMLKSTSGEILINDSVLDAKGTPDGLGYMLQRDHLFEWRNIYKNITLGLEIQRKKTNEYLEHAEDLINKYGLREFVRYYPHQLSGGMRQRAALIRTLSLDPELLLLDEPFSALDYQTRINVCDDVYKIIKREKKTALLVTHDIAEAISLADRIIILSKRPSTVMRIHETNLSDIELPRMRRKDPSFPKQYDKIWNDMV